MRDWACDVCADTGEVKQESGGMMPCRACELLTAPMEVVDAALVEMGLDPAEVKAHGDAFVEGLFERRARMAAIRARLAVATTDPWESDGRDVWGRSGSLYVAHAESEADAALIAHAPSDLTWLLAEVDRLNAKLEESR